MNTTNSNQTDVLIQNYLITFSHQINYEYSRIKNAFVIKAANITEEKALKVAEILFEPPTYTNLKIESIENDEGTLNPSEYQFLYDMLCNRRQADMRCEEIQRKNGKDELPYIETPNGKYITDLINKMRRRMESFPTYHT